MQGSSLVPPMRVLTDDIHKGNQFNVHCLCSLYVELKMGGFDLSEMVSETIGSNSKK
jgi:hypothetical protein